MALTTPWLDPLTLHGTHVTLAPLALHHHDELVDAVRDGELWNLWYTFVPSPERMRSEIERRLEGQAQGGMLPFVVIDQRIGHAVGMTTLYVDATTINLSAKTRRVEIGSTWYRKSVQRTALNTECKFLLLAHAFDNLGCIAVQFTTSSFNMASRRAIERLGAKLDGILRNHMVLSNGALRDTYVYSILVSEWPAVRAHLFSCLQQPRNSSLR